MHSAEHLQTRFDDKEAIVEGAREVMTGLGLTIVEENADKPWGAYFRFSDTDIERFVDLFFQDLDVATVEGSSLSPKLLIVSPGQKLSWQYHARRAEIWKVIAGAVGVAKSDTDEEGETHEYEVGETIELPHGTRHRGVGLDDWGYIAEIWQHTDPDNPSDEEDIIRLSDDYGREGTTTRK